MADWADGCDSQFVEKRSETVIFLSLALCLLCCSSVHWLFLHVSASTVLHTDTHAQSNTHHPYTWVVIDQSVPFLSPTDLVTPKVTTQVISLFVFYLCKQVNNSDCSLMGRSLSNPTEVALVFHTSSCLLQFKWTLVCLAKFVYAGVTAFIQILFGSLVRFPCGMKEKQTNHSFFCHSRSVMEVNLLRDFYILTQDHLETTVTCICISMWVWGFSLMHQKE